MAASFSLIYEKFTEMISDSTLALLPDDDLKEILYQYLDRAKTLEFKQCKADLSSINTPSKFTQSFNGDGVTTDFVINTPSVENSILIAKVNDEDIVDYTYDDATNTFHFVTPPTAGTDNVVLGWEFAGEFVADLTGEEIWILACGMLIGWLEPKIKEEKLMKETIGSKDIKKTSHANQLDKLMRLEELTRARLKRYINSYTFNKFEGLS